MTFVTAQPKAEGARSAMTTSIRDNSRAAAHHQAHRYVSGLNQYQIWGLITFNSIHNLRAAQWIREDVFQYYDSLIPASA